MIASHKLYASDMQYHKWSSRLANTLERNLSNKITNLPQLSAPQVTQSQTEVVSWHSEHSNSQLSDMEEKPWA